MNNDTDIQEAIEKLEDFFGNATFEEIMQMFDNVENNDKSIKYLCYN